MLRELLRTFIHTVIGAETDDALRVAWYGERRVEIEYVRGGHRHRQCDLGAGSWLANFDCGAARVSLSSAGLLRMR
jgi:transposase-like protein